VQPFISPCRPRRRRHHLQLPKRTFLSCAPVVLRCFPQLGAWCQPTMSGKGMWAFGDNLQLHNFWPLRIRNCPGTGRRRLLARRIVRERGWSSQRGRQSVSRHALTFFADLISLVHQMIRESSSACCFPFHDLLKLHLFADFFPLTHAQPLEEWSNCAAWFTACKCEQTHG
jgi:hypothetical protein